MTRRKQMLPLMRESVLASAGAAGSFDPMEKTQLPYSFRGFGQLSTCFAVARSAACTSQWAA